MDWTLIIVAVINGVVALMVALTLWQGKRTHNQFNDRMDQFIKLIKAVAYKKGRKDEKESR